jgi:hypothetical protein
LSPNSILGAVESFPDPDKSCALLIEEKSSDAANRVDADNSFKMLFLRVNIRFYRNLKPNDNWILRSFHASFIPDLDSLLTFVKAKDIAGRKR